MLFTLLMGTSELMTPEEIAQKRQKEKDPYFAHDSFLLREVPSHQSPRTSCATSALSARSIAYACGPLSSH